MNPESLGPLFQRPLSDGDSFVVALILALAAPAALIALAGLVRGRLPRGPATMGLVVLPLAAYGLANIQLPQVARQTEFCGSCHVMQPIAASLRVDDGTLASRHVRIAAIPSREVCYGCHAGYGVFGGIKAKVAGVRHMVTNLTGQVRYPLEINGRYDVAQCLDCHAQSEPFRKQDAHRPPEIQQALLDGSMACTGACHAAPHPESALVAPAQPR